MPGSLTLTMEQDERIAAAVEREGSRLRSFIRRRVPDERDVEDILQEVFFELVETLRVTRPIEQVGAWMFRVARNRIADLWRSKSREPHAPASATAASGARVGQGGPEDGATLALVDLLPSPEAGPEAAYARGVLIDELEAALDELPEEQREIFVAHELEGRSFKQLAAETGVGVNTLLSRKHYAVLHLRRRLRAIYDEFVEE